MLLIEITCQKYAQREGLGAKLVWNVDLSPSELEEVLDIPGVFKPNTRKVEQIEGVTIWAIAQPVLLLTILKSWKYRKPWVKNILDCFGHDAEFHLTWELRTILTNDCPEELLESEYPGEITTDALNYSEEDIDMLVSNLGSEDHLE